MIEPTPPFHPAIAPESLPAPTAAHAIVFIESDVGDYQTLLDGLAPGTEVHVLDAGTDGLAYMAQVLDGRSDIDALHIVSHGKEGTVSLGSLQLSSDNLPARADDLAIIRAALSPGADILLYGCDVGAGTNGAAFLAQLAQATGADIAASTDLTGSADLGGNWVLEQSTGAIASHSPFSQGAMLSYSGLLAWSGVADGTYDFDYQGDLSPNNGGNGFVKYGDKFLITNGIDYDGMSGIYYATANAPDATLTIKAEGGTTAKSFTFQDMTFSLYSNDGSTTVFFLNALSIITKDVGGNVIATHTMSGTYSPGTTAPFTASALTNSGASFTDQGVAQVIISWKIGSTVASASDAGNLTFESIKIANVSATSGPSAPPPPDLAAASDSGASANDNITNANTLAFTGTSTAANGSTVRVFLDKNNNGAYDAGDATATGTVSNGNWSVASVNVSGVADGLYNVYAQVTAADSGLTSPRSTALAVTLDRTAPMVAISSSASTLKAGQTATITFTFSEDPGSSFNWDGANGSIAVSGGMLSAISGSGTTRQAIFTPAANVNNGTASITVAAGAYKDAAGNAGGAGSAPALTYDTLAPNVSSIVRAGPTNTNATSASYTVTFDSNVTGVDGSDFVLSTTGTATGTIASQVAGSGTTYTVTVNNITGDGTIRLDLKGSGTGIVDGAGNAAPAYTSGQSYTFDHTGPAVSSVAVPASATYGAGQPLEFTANFNEAVTVDTTSGTPAVSLRLDTGGVVQAAYVSGSGSTALTFRYIVANGNADANGVEVLGAVALNGGTIRDAAGNNAALALNSIASTSGVLVSALGPAVSAIERVGAAVTNAASVDYAVTFSSSVSGVDAGDFTLAGSGATGSIASVRDSGDGKHWIVTVDQVTGDGMLRLDLNAGGTGIVDASNQPIAGGYTSGQAYTIDHTPPAIDGAIAISDTGLRIGDSATVTFAFTEAVAGFTVDDVTVPNGTLSDLVSADGGRTWTATLRPIDGASSATNTLVLDYAGIHDLAGNAGTGTAHSGNYAVDTVRPSLQSGIAISDTALKIGDSATVTFTFAEPVVGFDTADVGVSNGTLSDLHSSDGGRTWTATLTPASGASAGANVLTLHYDGIADQAGNIGTGTIDSGNYAVDTVRPGLVSDITISDTALTAGETATVTFSFDEAVTGFDIGDVTVANGKLKDLASSDGGRTWTATLTPDADVRDAANVLTLDYAGIADLAGNAGVGTVDSGNYAVDTKAPALAQPIAISDTALKSGDSATVTFVFGEAVTGFTVDDVFVPYGTLTDLFSVDGGISWTATLTPAAGASSAANVLTLDYTGIRNLAGNAGVGNAASPGYAVDTKAPTASVTLSDADLRAGETATVTVTFSEAVTGFTGAAVSAPNGTLGAFATSDQGRTWSATFTPTAAKTATGNVVTVDLAGVADLAGNPAAAGSITSAPYAIDTTPAPAGPTPATPPSSGTVDGVQVITETRPADPVTGLVSTVLTVPVITATRADDPNTPNGSLADIPLGLGTAGQARTELTVSLPIGTGMTVEGPDLLLSNAQALLDLIRRIEKQTVSGSSAQTGMTGNGTGFLGQLAPDTLLQSKTVVLTSAAGASTPHTILIDGSSTVPPAGGHNATAIGLVIDTTGLPAGSTLQLNNVDFAAIVGAATLRGGDGRNIVTGDDASQNIFLGAEDDELHGGGGNDVVGSAGGNDLLDGGDGDDVVVGGIGNDRLIGGAGNDVLQGGRSSQGAWSFYLAADGTLKALHDTLLFAPGQEEDIALSDLNGAAKELGFLGADKAMLSALSLMYHTAFGRAPDVGGLTFWAQDGTSAKHIAAEFLASPEWRSSMGGDLSDAAFVQALYQHALGRAPEPEGLAFWTARLAGTDGPALSRADVLLGVAFSAEHQQVWNTRDGYLIGADQSGAETDWIAGSGDDRLEGGAGSDVLVGGDGIDTAVYAGSRSDYQFIIDRAGHLKVADKANGDVDQLFGIEKGEFGDGTLDLGFLQGNLATLKQLGLLYQTVLDRAGDIEGFQWWLNQKLDPASLAAGFLQAPEVRARYDGLDDGAFVKALYGNTGLDASAAGGQASWEHYLANHTRAELVAAWVASEGVANAQFAGQGLWLV